MLCISFPIHKSKAAVCVFFGFGLSRGSYSFVCTTERKLVLRAKEEGAGRTATFKVSAETVTRGAGPWDFG